MSERMADHLKVSMTVAQFDAAVAEAAAERCAPLVALLEKLANDRIRTELRADGYSVGDYFAAKAEEVLRAHREREVG